MIIRDRVVLNLRYKFLSQFVRMPDGKMAGVDWEFNGWGGDVLPDITQDKKAS